MNKISSILPGNSRISSVDMRRTSPVRTGVPAFGREVVEPTNQRALAKTVLNEASFTYGDIAGSKAKMREQAQMVDQIADKFFARKAVEEEALPAKSNLVVTAPSVEAPVRQVGTNIAVKA